MTGASVSGLRSQYAPFPKKIFRPRQLALFTNHPEPIPIGIYREPEEGKELVIDEGLSLIKNEGSSQLIISGLGTFLSHKNERMVVRKEDKVIYEFPLRQVNEVIVYSGGVFISSDLITELCHHGIRLSLLRYSGEPYAMITSPMLTTTTISRREQILAFEDRRGVEFSKIIISAKLRNQEKLLLYFNRHFRITNNQRLQKIQDLADALRVLRYKLKNLQGQKIDEVRDSLINLGKSGNNLYWEGVREIINQKFEFLGKIHQDAPLVVDSLLNYGNGILYSQIWGSIIQAGLEPFAGFIHIDQPGQSSLVLDLAEEFRQPVVDLTIISHVNLGEVRRMENGLLDPETRLAIAQKILHRLESIEIYDGKKYQIKSIIQKQARHLALFLRGERKYLPFRFTW